MTLSLQEVSNLLRTDWNPIDVNWAYPGDEYAAYAPEVHRILLEQLPLELATARIASYLTWVRVHMMGLSYVSGCVPDAAAAVVILEAWDDR